MYKSFLKYSPIAHIACDLNLEISYINIRFEELFEWKEDDIIGKKLSVLFGDNIIEYKVKQLEAEQWISSNKFISSVVLKSGRRKLIEIALSDLFRNNNKVGYILAITNENIENHNDNETQVLKEAFMKNPLGLAVLDCDMKIEYINHILSSQIGNDPKKAVNQSIESVLSDEISESVKMEITGKLKIGKEWNSEVLRKNNKFEYYWEQIKIFPLLIDGKETLKYLYVSEDITADKILQQQILINDSLQAVINSKINFGLCIVNYISRKIIYLNRKFCELLNVSDNFDEIQNGNVDNENTMNLLVSNIINLKEINFIYHHYNNPLNKITYEEDIKIKNGKILRNSSSILKDKYNNSIGRIFVLEDISSDGFVGKMSPRDNSDFGNNTQISIVNEVNPVIVFDSEGNIKSFNESACYILGYNNIELMTKKYSQLTGENVLELFSPSSESEKEYRNINDQRLFIKKDNSRLLSKVQINFLPGKLLQFILLDNIHFGNDGYTSVSNYQTSRFIIENIFLKLKAFKHGQESHNCLNRLSLYVKNYKILKDSSDNTNININENESYKKFLNLIKEYNGFIKPQIEYITVLLNSVKYLIPDITASEIIEKSRGDLIFESELLSDNLRKFNNQLMQYSSENFEMKNITSILLSIKYIKEKIREVDNLIYKNFISDIHKVIDELIFKYSRLYPDIKINNQIYSNNPQIIFAPYELHELLNIILENSLEAYNGEKTDSKEFEIFINIRYNNDRTILELSDNGPGISYEVKQKLFKQNATTKGKNRGFGLLYANNIVQKYGGVIEIADNIGGGTKFIINFKTF